MQSRAALAGMLGAIIAGCGDNTSVTADADADVDAEPPDAEIRLSCDQPFELPTSVCWSTENTVMKGEAILGMGEFAFEPMGDELVLLQEGQLSQNHVIVNVRMRGLEPGDLKAGSWGGINPRTRVVPYFEDTGRRAKSSPCPYRHSYVPIDAETFGMPDGMGMPVPFDTCWKPTAHLLDRRVIFRLEIVDGCGSYAVAEQTVTLRAKPGWQYKDDPLQDPGCPE